MELLTREIWNRSRINFGAVAPIYGTLVTSAIAMLVAVPIGFGNPIFLTQLAPAWLKRPVGVAIELLAAVPSIISASGVVCCGADSAAARAARLIETWEGSRSSVRCFRPPFGIGVLTAGAGARHLVLPFTPR